MRSPADTLDSEQAMWRQFAQAATPPAFCEGWLSLQCHMLAGVKSGVVLLGEPDKGPFSPVAVYPNPTVSIKHLTATAERTLKERRGLLAKNESPQEGAQIAYPLEVAARLHGVVVIETVEQRPAELQDMMRMLHWGAAWLEVMLRRSEAVRSAESQERLQRVLEMVATVVEHDGFSPAAMAFVTRLATLLECGRVSLGFEKRKRVRVAALSHSTDFGKKMGVVRAIESAMNEAVDQQSVVVYPIPAGTVPVSARAHGELARDQGATSTCTVPLEQKGVLFGALTLERANDKAFDPSTIELIKTIAAVAGPILEVKRKESRPVAIKAAKAAGFQIAKLVGPGHLGLKLGAALITSVVLFFAFFKWDYRVAAPTSLEGTVQRVISAPFNGFVAEAPARPGDVVHQGALLARLDDRDLKLERLKWATQQEQFGMEHSQAIAEHNRAQVGILQAKIDESKAQLRLIDEQLSRSKIVAPFDGVVTSGDLSQSLGTPVERGQGLFEVAPLGSYRVILQVDERDIAQVREKQQGELALPSLPGIRFPLTVSQITPVSTQKDGRNYFRVEAKMEQHSLLLRPGMEGIGKVKIERRLLIWIWTHELIEWVRLKLWTWLP